MISKNDLENRLSYIYNSGSTSYSKRRLSGSKMKTYIMHCRSKCMPGQQSLFTNNPNSKPREVSKNRMSQIRDAFKLANYVKENNVIGEKSTQNSKDLFTYEQFHPHSDEALLMAIQAVYIQVFGNLRPMESERPKDIERRLRNGDISIREFLRNICKSDFYKKYYLENVNQSKCIELSFMHLLGRPLIDNKEFESNIKLINEEGFERHIDSLIDSLEYQEIFGEDIVPYPRFWNSPCGSTTSIFKKTTSFRIGSASSDNVTY
ncbi:MULTISPECIES: phycobilisome rod-core linker polypeptide [unclassified Prochlorococcus]|uniref:phycobilisome rod-core linker polypeptide n=1 Tax=unclassified Prochlorococcus TaxID=2627481 RepID=UPI001F4C97AB|nr:MULTISPECIES: phycobilisome rod-core linker polypeptide [unclassified Prochlorococcus]